MEAGDDVPLPAPSVPVAGGEVPPLVPVLDLHNMQCKDSESSETVPSGSDVFSDVLPIGAATRPGNGQQGRQSVHRASGGSRGRVGCLASASRKASGTLGGTSLARECGAYGKGYTSACPRPRLAAKPAHAVLCLAQPVEGCRPAQGLPGWRHSHKARQRTADGRCTSLAAARGY